MRDDAIVAHENPDLLGLPASEVNGPDQYPAGLMVVAAATADGAWVDYQFNNPATGQAEIKHSWVVQHDGLTFGSGWYEAAPSREHAPGAFTKSYVERALELYRVLGREAAIEYYNSPQSIDGQWYLFIHSVDGIRVVNGARADRPGWLGSSLHGTGVDVTGYDYTADTLAIDPSGWISYIFPNPDDELRYQRKHSWIVRHDGLLFGSGWYDRNYDLAEQNPAGYARALVQTAIDRYEADGREATLESLQLGRQRLDGRVVRGFIIASERATSARPSLRSPDSSENIAQTVRSRCDRLRHFRAPPSSPVDGSAAWVSYVFANPAHRLRTSRSTPGSSATTAYSSRPAGTNLAPTKSPNPEPASASLRVSGTRDRSPTAPPPRRRRSASPRRSAASYRRRIAAGTAGSARREN